MNDIETIEDLEQENLNLYKELGQCSVDKKEIKDIVTGINKESN